MVIADSTEGFVSCILRDRNALQAAEGRKFPNCSVSEVASGGIRWSPCQSETQAPESRFQA